MSGSPARRLIVQPWDVSCAEMVRRAEAAEARAAELESARQAAESARKAAESASAKDKIARVAAEARAAELDTELKRLRRLKEKPAGE